MTLYLRTKGAAIAASTTVLLLLGVGAGIGFGDSLPPDPASNISLAVPMPSDCTASPTGAACENAAKADLNSARASMDAEFGTHLGPYTFPADFTSMPPGEQWLILGNEDRIGYGQQPIVGLNAAVDAAAQQALQAAPDSQGNDPDPGYPTSGIPQGWGWRSNVAWGYPNALFAYYSWMYADGYPSANDACSKPSDSGCWGHRHDVLAFSDSANNIMGAATGPDTLNRTAYEMEIVNAQSSQPLEYTWAQAVADGASQQAPPATTAPTTSAPSGGGGGGSAPPAATTTTTATQPPAATTVTSTQPVTTTVKPPAVKFLLTLVKAGNGSVKVRPASWNHKYVAETLVTLTAQAKPGWKFSKWSGPCSGHKPVCIAKMNNNRKVTATFIKVKPRKVAKKKK